MLQTLDIRRCKSLANLLLSLGKMKSLGFLHASRCDEISRLLEFICQLDVLEELKILGCGKLTNNLPIGFFWNLGIFL
jgi:hypothetical protein